MRLFFSIRLLALVSASLLFSHVHADESLMMSNIKLQVVENFNGPLGDKVQFEFVSANAAKVLNELGQWQHIEATKISEDRLLIAIPQFPQYTGEVLPRYSKDSWVIDIEEESTSQFIREYQTETSSSKDLVTLTQFVNSYIDKPTYIHGFNIASMVAKQKSGDCTEFATLTTSLSRALGMPARLVLGVVIMEEEGEPKAFGHAWTEVHKEDEWHVIDAALYGYEAGKRYYLPTGTLENEGLGFMMSLAGTMLNLPRELTEFRSL